MATDSDAVVRAGLSSVTKGTLFLLVSTLLLVALTFVSRVVIVRSVSPADWSAFSFGLTLAGVLGALGSLGLPTAVARSLPYATTDDERRTIVRGTLWIGSVAALGSSLLLFVFAQPIGQSLGSPRITLGLQYFPIAVGSGIVASLIASIFQGYEDVTPNALFIQIVNPTLFVAFLAFAIVAPPLGISYHEALLAYALASVATLGLLVVYLVLRLPHHLAAGLRSPTALPRFLRFVAPLFVVSVMGTITGSADTLVLGIFHPLEVGTYTASLTLARLLPIGIGAAAYIFLPVASRFLRLNEPRSIGITYVTVTKWMTLISLPLFLLFFFLPSSCLGFVYGPNYTAIVVPLQIVVAGAFATTLLGPASTAQVAFGQTRLLAANAIAAGVADVVVAFALVPTVRVRWGGDRLGGGDRDVRGPLAGRARRPYRDPPVPRALGRPGPGHGAPDRGRAMVLPPQPSLLGPPRPRSRDRPSVRGARPRDPFDRRGGPPPLRGGRAALRAAPSVLPAPRAIRAAAPGSLRRAQSPTRTPRTAWTPRRDRARVERDPLKGRPAFLPR